MKKDLVSARRVYVLVAVMGLWGTAIATRLYFLQVVHSETYRKSANTQQQRTVPIIPPRGGIYDRNGNALAVSVPIKSIYADPAEVEDVAATAKTIASITGMPVAQIADKLTEPGRFVWIKRKASESETLAIRTAKLPGIGISDEFQRSYPNKELASQVLGYVSTDQQGLGGLEAQYEEIIRGEKGTAVYLTDGKRRRYNETEEPAQPGARLITTLDKNIQYFVRQGILDAVERTHAVAIHVIVMDPRNGEILAMENAPTFDPNNFGASDPHDRKNGSIDHTYEP